MLACLLSGSGTFSCFSAGVRGNIAYTRVCNSSIFCVCLSWLFGGWGRCSVCSYIGECTKGKAGENHEACKRWMCALITVMAIVAFHLLSLKYLIVPSSWWCKFLPRLITHTESYWACSKAVRHLCMHACTDIWKYDMHRHTHTHMHAKTPAQLHGRWQWPGTLQQWQGQEGSGHHCALRRDELSSASCNSTISYNQANLHLPAFGSSQNSLRSKKFSLTSCVCETSAD